MQAIQAIPTEYKGCFFRSRLEARWAVFFDALCIKWEYEPEGLVVRSRLVIDEQNASKQTYYLPDFWLPEFKIYAEVKGSLSVDQAINLLDIAACISSGGASGCRGGNDVIILGPIPSPDNLFATQIPWQIHMHKGGLVAAGIDLSQEFSDVNCPCGDRKTHHIASDWCGTLEECFAGHDIPALDCIPNFLLDGCPIKGQHIALNNAYRAARSARFEHGHSGRTL